MGGGFNGEGHGKVGMLGVVVMVGKVGIVVMLVGVRKVVLREVVEMRR